MALHASRYTLLQCTRLPTTPPVPYLLVPSVQWEISCAALWGVHIQWSKSYQPGPRMPCTPPIESYGEFVSCTLEKWGSYIVRSLWSELLGDFFFAEDRSAYKKPFVVFLVEEALYRTLWLCECISLSQTFIVLWVFFCFCFTAKHKKESAKPPQCNLALLWYS